MKILNAAFSTSPNCYFIVKKKKIQISISHQAELIWFCAALLDGAISEVWHLNKNSVLYVGHQLPSTDYFHSYYLISDSHNSVEQALPRPSFHRCLIRKMENIGNMPRASELVREQCWYFTQSDLESPSFLSPPLPSLHINDIMQPQF